MSAALGGPRLEILLRARRFDDVLLDHAEAVQGALLLSIGQEGTATAAALARTPADALFLNHRNHHHLVANGCDVHRLYGEIFGRDVGFQRGRSGTLHICEPDLGILHTSAMVGGGVGPAVGAALARKRLGRPGISYVFFGDGAIGEGVVSEGFGLSRMWDVPIVFVCEANTTADIDNPVQAAHRGAAASFTDVPSAYRIETHEADGTNPEEVAGVIAVASERARSGAGPQFVLSQTVPWPGHKGWRPTPVGRADLRRAETGLTEGWERFDPLLREARSALAGGATLDELLDLDARVTAEMDDAAAQALQAPLAPPEVAYDNVLAGER